MIKKVLRIITLTLVSCLVCSNLWVIGYRFVPPPVTLLQLQRLLGHGNAINYNWVPLKDMSPHLAHAVIASEDQLFLEHWGFDFKAIEKTIEANRRGRRLAGASTISQQTAKNAFLWAGRTWLRKGLEVYFTLLIELWWPKQRIIEIYLNIIEMGPGVYGAQAAAQYHFGKDARQLTRGEAASIAAILPLPLKWSATKPIAKVRGRIQKIKGQMSKTTAPQFD